MIATYSEYIDCFISQDGLGERTLPGEHHFVAVYLLPRISGILEMVPDYVNPDGTKGIVGDLVFSSENGTQLTIEVKLDTVRLTKNEFNTGIVDDDDMWPDVFIGIGVKGMVALPWVDFRQAYVDLVRIERPDWVPHHIEEGYGPQRKVNKLLATLEDDEWFAHTHNPEQAIQSEQEFMELLRELLDF